MRRPGARPPVSCTHALRRIAARSLPIGISLDVLFMIACLGFCALLAAWLVTAFAAALRGRAVFGIIGSLLAAMLLGALWQADRLPWLWAVVKIMPAIWMVALTLNGFATASGRGRSHGVLVLTVTLSVVGFLLHALGGFAFLWAASMGI
jgi:hypothetical protein